MHECARYACVHHIHNHLVGCRSDNVLASQNSDKWTLWSNVPFSFMIIIGLPKINARWIAICRSIFSCIIQERCWVWYWFNVNAAVMINYSSRVDALKAGMILQYNECALALRIDRMNSSFLVRDGSARRRFNNDSARIQRPSKAVSEFFLSCCICTMHIIHGTRIIVYRPGVWNVLPAARQEKFCDPRRCTRETCL